MTDGTDGRDRTDGTDGTDGTDKTDETDKTDKTDGTDRLVAGDPPFPVAGIPNGLIEQPGEPARTCTLPLNGLPDIIRQIAQATGNMQRVSEFD
jgi:hypothetical protein